MLFIKKHTKKTVIYKVKALIAFYLKLDKMTAITFDTRCGVYTFYKTGDIIAPDGKSFDKAVDDLACMLPDGIYDITASHYTGRGADVKITTPKYMVK